MKTPITSHVVIQPQEYDPNGNKSRSERGTREAVITAISSLPKAQTGLDEVKSARTMHQHFRRSPQGEEMKNFISESNRYSHKLATSHDEKFV